MLRKHCGGRGSYRDVRLNRIIALAEEYVAVEKVSLGEPRIRVVYYEPPELGRHFVPTSDATDDWRNAILQGGCKSEVSVLRSAAL